MYEKYTLLQREEIPQGGLLWNMVSAFELIGQEFQCFIYRDTNIKGNIAIDLDVENDDVYISYTFDGDGKELYSFYMSGKNYSL